MGGGGITSPVEMEVSGSLQQQQQRRDEIMRAIAHATKIEMMDGHVIIGALQCSGGSKDIHTGVTLGYTPRLAPSCSPAAFALKPPPGDDDQGIKQTLAKLIIHAVSSAEDEDKCGLAFRVTLVHSETGETYKFAPVASPTRNPATTTGVGPVNLRDESGLPNKINAESQLKSDGEDVQFVLTDNQLDCAEGMKLLREGNELNLPEKSGVSTWFKLTRGQVSHVFASGDDTLCQCALFWRGLSHYEPRPPLVFKFALLQRDRVIAQWKTQHVFFGGKHRGDRGARKAIEPTSEVMSLQRNAASLATLSPEALISRWKAANAELKAVEAELTRRGKRNNPDGATEASEDENTKAAKRAFFNATENLIRCANLADRNM